MNIQAISIILLAASFPVGAATTITGRVVGISDGDTLTLLDGNNTQHKIRLGQIDAPEVGHGRGKPPQAFGERSRQSLSDLVFGQQVTAACDGQSYERLVCQVTVGSMNVNMEQVRRGMAWAYPKYVRDPAFYRDHDQARINRVGLWADAKPIPPWEWRHGGAKNRNGV